MAGAVRMWPAIVALTGLVVAGCSDARLLEQLQAASPRPDLHIQPASENTSVASQQSLGDHLAQSALKVMKRSDDRELEDYLNVIVQRLEQALPVDHRVYRYRVYLIDSPQPNAFTPGGGHIFVTTGIIVRLRSEAQVAMVLAHEMAHNTASHVVKGREGRNLTRKVSALGKEVFDDKLGVPWLSQGVSAIARTSLNSYTRAQEEQADRIGFEYLVSAGYDPFEAERSFMALIDTNAQKKSLLEVFKGYPNGLARAEWIRQTVHVRYRGVDTSGLTRTTRTFDRLASPYWQG